MDSKLWRCCLKTEIFNVVEEFLEIGIRYLSDYFRIFDIRIYLRITTRKKSFFTYIFYTKIHLKSYDRIFDWIKRTVHWFFERVLFDDTTWIRLMRKYVWRMEHSFLSLEQILLMLFNHNIHDFIKIYSIYS